MCGIYGMVSLAEAPLRHPQRLGEMGVSLRHRGPDGTGQCETPHAAIGAERLRIVDRRSRADQPFDDGGGRWLVANGEIYNAAAIRAQFSTYGYRSRSDIECLLPLLAARGADGLDDVDGMFALALWNARDRSLLLARDRAGEKPLFYLRVGSEVWFASEIQALLRHPCLGRAIDDAAVTDYLALGYVREPRTLFRHVRKIPAGSAVVFHGASCTRRAIEYPAGGTPRSPEAAVARLLELLENAVAKQLRADVPVGVFTSGGVDSSLIAAIAANRSPGRLHTFTARVHPAPYDEGAFGRRLAAQLGTRHHEVTVDERGLTGALDLVSERFVEPLADPALLPTLLLARAAKRHVGVALSGEGADELFGGYPTYLGHQLAPALTRVPARALHVLHRAIAPLAASHSRVPVAFLADRLLRHAADDWISRHLSWFGTGLFPLLPPPARDALRTSLADQAHDTSAVASAMTLDFTTYLREGLLVKLDRAAMLASLETRAPYLDAHVTAFARGLPLSWTVRGARTKWLLKAAARERLPAWVVRRRKQGFSVPVAAWVNGSLRGEVDRLLAPERLARLGVLADLPIAQLLSEHRSGRANHGRPLWALIVLQRWFERWVRQEKA